jgi:hypothetical protein
VIFDSNSIHSSRIESAAGAEPQLRSLGLKIHSPCLASNAAQPTSIATPASVAAASRIGFQT